MPRLSENSLVYAYRIDCYRYLRLCVHWTALAQVLQGEPQEAEVDPGGVGLGGQLLGDTDLGATVPARPPGQHHRKDGLEGRQRPRHRQDPESAKRWRSRTRQGGTGW